MSKLKKSNAGPSFIKELIRLRMSELMMFRLGFFGPFFVDGSMFVIQLLVFSAIYEHVDTIGGWGEGEMILFIGTYSLLNAVNMFLYFFGVISIPEKIKTGELDLYITKPVNPLLNISFEKLNPGSIPLIIMSIGIIFYGINKLNISVTPGRVIGYIVFLLFMQVLYYDCEVILRTTAFFTISTNVADKIENAGLDLCMKLPGIAFYGIYKFIFYFILPYGIMATLPTQLLNGELSLKGVMYGIIITVIFTITMYRFWKFGLRHYNSASS